MPRKLHNALTSIGVKNAKPGRHADGGGLHLLVKPTGARSWVYRFMLNGKSRDIGLGAAGQGGMSLADARDEAAALRLKVKAGIDPLQERDRKAAQALAAAQAAKVAQTTFKDASAAYIAANEEGWRNPKHRQQWRNTLESYVYPVIGDLPVAEVGTAHVLQILEPIWSAKAETASRIRGRIETVLDSAKARGYRSGENPARWRGHLAQILPSRKRLSRGHHPALPHEEIAGFMSLLGDRNAVAALALEFTILTAARSGEVDRREVERGGSRQRDLGCPSQRMKTAKEHRVPLSSRAVDILLTTRELGSDWLFPGATGGKLSSMAMSMLIRRMHESALRAGRRGYLDDQQQRVASVHGFRSTFRDWADEHTAYPHEMKEMALAHAIGNKAEAAYRRRDMFNKRRALMNDWADYCLG